mgnify:CR=1 FL=1
MYTPVFENSRALSLELPSPLSRLAQYDAAPFAPELSPENARSCWTFALHCAATADNDRPLSGHAPRCVLLIASANVFTAPLEWAWQLSQRGVRVVIKAAREHSAVVHALAAELPGVEAREWKGGVDLDPEAQALSEADAVLAFGRDDTLDTIRQRLRAGTPFCAFGAKFGVAVVDSLDAETAGAVAADFALYDGAGCMSPVGVFARAVDIGAVELAMSRAQARWPRGPVSDHQGVLARRTSLLARANPEPQFTSVEHPDFSILSMGADYLADGASPRQMVIYPWKNLTDVAVALFPFREGLGTVGTQPALAETLLRLLGPSPRRFCELGRMQTPPASRLYHDGVDVLARLWAGA